MQKVFIVVQRFGKNINGGAEVHAEKLCLHLISQGIQPTVLTSASRNHLTWSNERFIDIPPVSVIRFPSVMNRWSLLCKVLIVLRSIALIPAIKILIERTWLIFQGPYCPDLIRFIKRQDDESLFIFFTYLYFPTTEGIKHAKKSILIPTAHDELPFYFTTTKETLELATKVIVNTEPERRLIQKVHGISGIEVGAFGLDFSIKKTEQLYEDRKLLYAGRVSVGKNIHNLIEMIGSLEKVNLTIAGELDSLRPPILPSWLNYLGYVSRKDLKIQILSSLAVINPSTQESMSLIVLESLQLGVPVILNSNCEVFSFYIKEIPLAFGFRDTATLQDTICSIRELRSDQKTYKTAYQTTVAWLQKNFSWDKINDAIKVV